VFAEFEPDSCSAFASLIYQALFRRRTTRAGIDTGVQPVLKNWELAQIHVRLIV
jgi:hypothetical protein